MERNGLLDRKREAKVGKWVLGVSLFFLVSFFLAPLTLERGTVGPMEGRANRCGRLHRRGRSQKRQRDES